MLKKLYCILKDDQAHQQFWNKCRLLRYLNNLD